MREAREPADRRRLGRRSSPSRGTAAWARSRSRGSGGCGASERERTASTPGRTCSWSTDKEWARPRSSRSRGYSSRRLWRWGEDTVLGLEDDYASRSIQRSAPPVASSRQSLWSRRPVQRDSAAPDRELLLGCPTKLLDREPQAPRRRRQPMSEPARIRNVAVVGHRGTGKTSLVEALLFQTGKINRLGTVEAGTTVSDADEDEHKRQLSISMSLEHTEWQDRKVNLIDVPGDPAFQGELRCAARVVEGTLVTVSAVMGVEVGTSRAWRLADELGLARVVFVNMLDRERADFFRTLEALRNGLSTKCVAVHLPIGAEHELTGIVDVLHMCAYASPEGAKEGEPGPDPGRDGRARGRVPREAPRRRRRDGRGAHGALPRRTGARRARGRRRARRLPSRAATCSRSPAASRRRTSARTRSSTSSSRAFPRRRRRARRSTSTAPAPRRSSSRPSPTRSPAASTSSAC